MGFNSGFKGLSCTSCLFLYDSHRTLAFCRKRKPVAAHDTKACRGSGRLPPLISNLFTAGSSVVGLTSQQLCSRQKVHQSHTGQDAGGPGPRAGVDALETQENDLHLRVFIKLRNVQPVISLLHVPTEPSQKSLHTYITTTHQSSFIS